MILFDRFISWLYTYRLFGARCPDYDANCPCCKAWDRHDFVVSACEPQ